jgi:transcriptional regulator with XRE-family HTH domain
VKKDLEEHIKIKIAASLQKLLNSSDKAVLARSYNKIASASDMRKATVSDTFNAKTIPSSSTLILILDAMGNSISDFARVYETITDSEMLAFKRGIL